MAYETISMTISPCFVIRLNQAAVFVHAISAVIIPILSIVNKKDSTYELTNNVLHTVKREEDIPLNRPAHQIADGVFFYTTLESTGLSPISLTALITAFFALSATFQ
eukprot:2716063-Rhodomonas_salina.1